MCDVGRNVLRPLFGGVEGDDANRIFVLALKQIEDHGFQIGGFDVGARKIYLAGVRSHRILDPSDASAEVHLAVGADIETWRARPGAREVAYVDPRSPAERVEYERLRRQAIRGLQAAGLVALVPAVDNSLFTTIIDSRVPERPRELMIRMRDLGLPTAVFVAPPDTR